VAGPCPAGCRLRDDPKYKRHELPELNRLVSSLARESTTVPAPRPVTPTVRVLSWEPSYLEGQAHPDCVDPVNTTTAQRP
jgi:hypothetical protein